MRAVQVICEFSLLLCQKNHSKPFLTIHCNALHRYFKMRSAFQEQTMSKSVVAKVVEQLARESNQSEDQKIHKICTTLDVQESGAAKITTTRWRRYYIHLSRA
jgi:hypothetical protein